MRWLHQSNFKGHVLHAHVLHTFTYPLKLTLYFSSDGSHLKQERTCETANGRPNPMLMGNESNHNSMGDQKNISGSFSWCQKYGWWKSPRVNDHIAIAEKIFPIFNRKYIDETLRGPHVPATAMLVDPVVGGFGSMLWRKKRLPETKS